jgi:hypothetical protein
MFGGAGSYTEVTNNPRTFVMDANNVITLPLMEVTNEKTGEQCNVTRSLDGTSKEECRPQYKQTTNFW